MAHNWKALSRQVALEVRSPSASRTPLFSIIALMCYVFFLMMPKLALADDDVKFVAILIADTNDFGAGQAIKSGSSKVEGAIRGLQQILSNLMTTHTYIISGNDFT